MGLVEQHHALNRLDRPICSVCIANYNGVALLDDCLASVLSQQGGIGIEIIVHDDASSDASIDLIRDKYPQVELLMSRENVGFCVANNRMVAHARGRFILLLNNDAALHPDALLTLIRTAQERDPPGILTLPQYDWNTMALVDRGCLLDPFYNPVPNLDVNRHDVAMAIGACLFMPRGLWDELGGFPEWMDSIAEDMYLCCLARLRGRSVTVTTGSGYRHRQGATFGGNRVDFGRLHSTFRRRRLSEQNKTAVMLICTPTLLVWPLLMVHLIELAVEGTALTLLRWDGRIWKQTYAPAISHIFRHLGRLQQYRKQVQLYRQVGLSKYSQCAVLLPRKLSMLLRYGVPTLK
jgi:GT2 family glycosyltransferase